MQKYSSDNTWFYDKVNMVSWSKMGNLLTVAQNWTALVYKTFSDENTIVHFKQVRIEGKAERISEDKSREYFNSRPKESQLGAIVSKQSTVVPDRMVSYLSLPYCVR